MLPLLMNVKNMLDPTLRFNTTRGGAMAVSGKVYSTARKARKRMMNVVSRPMILGEDQGEDVPPHWSARMRHTILGTKKSSPSGSSRFAFVSSGSFDASTF